MKYLKQFEQFVITESVLDSDADKGEGSIPSGTIIGSPDKSKSLEELEKEGNYKPGSYLDSDDKGKGSVPSGTIIGSPDKSKSLEELEKEGNYKPGSYLD
jgi:hypothetical protein